MTDYTIGGAAALLPDGVTALIGTWTIGIHSSTGVSFAPSGDWRGATIAYNTDPDTGFLEFDLPATDGSFAYEAQFFSDNYRNGDGTHLGPFVFELTSDLSWQDIIEAPELVPTTPSNVLQAIAARQAAQDAAVAAQTAAASVQREQVSGVAGLTSSGKLYESRIPDRLADSTLALTYAPFEISQHPSRKLNAEGLRGSRAYYDYRSPEATWTVLRTITVANDTELAAAVAGLLPGDEIVVTGDVSNDYVIDTIATAANPVIIRAASPLGSKFNGKIIIRNSQYVYLVGFDLGTTGYVIINAVSGGSNGSYNKLVGCRIAGGNIHVDLQGGASYNEILFCEFDGAGGTTGQGVCIKLNNDAPSARTYGNRIAYCWFHDFSAPEVNGSEPIQVGQNVNSTHWEVGTVIEFNLFERCVRDDELISLKSSSNIVRWNEFRDSSRSGDGSWLTLRNGHANQVIENLLIDCLGIRVWGDDALVTGNLLLRANIEIMSGDCTQDNVSDVLTRPATRRARVFGNDLNGGTITVGAGGFSVSSAGTRVYGNTDATVVLETQATTDQTTYAPKWSYSPLPARVR